MTDHFAPGTLVDHLVADLKPVRRLPTPARRTLLWLAVVLALAIALGSVADLAAVRHRLQGAPDMWLAVIGSAATAALAAMAAFELALPDRSRLWALLPLPGLALWITASGLGCARSWLLPGMHEASWADTESCLTFIVGLSVPLSLLTIIMLRRGYTLSPTLTGAVGGLAVAAAAATLLNFFHPYDAALEDLFVHATAIAIVVVANRIVGGRLLGDRDLKTRERVDG